MKQAYFGSAVGIVDLAVASLPPIGSGAREPAGSTVSHRANSGQEKVKNNGSRTQTSLGHRFDLRSAARPHGGGSVPNLLLASVLSADVAAKWPGALSEPGARGSDLVPAPTNVLRAELGRIGSRPPECPSSRKWEPSSSGRMLPQQVSSLSRDPGDFNEK